MKFGSEMEVIWKELRTKKNTPTGPENIFSDFYFLANKNNKTKSHHSTVVEVSDSLHKELQSLPACWVSGRGAQTPSHTQ